MAASAPPFHERLSAARRLSSLNEPTSASIDDVALAANVTAVIGYPVSTEQFIRWCSGQELPSASVRRAFAEALGFHGPYYSRYLAADEPAVVIPMHTQVQTFVALAMNGTGLVALRRAQPVLPTTASELARLV